MEPTDNEWLQEQQRVDEVTDRIGTRLVRLRDEVEEARGHAVEIRKEFWDDVRVNLDHSDDVAETVTTIKQQAEVLSQRERTQRSLQEQLFRLVRLEQSPYFGRIDFKENGEDGEERIYVGLASFLDETGSQFYVYDWRAPVSSMYYDYSPGPAAHETPEGSITGTMDLKRQFVIRDKTIRSLFDTGVTIGDELLQQVLGRGADSQMKTIVATIQKEQNLIIRNERSRMLIVQGAAGSGKTSAALQRVAYLLYNHRETLKADQIVLFSPNPMFNSYISTVLPELGEENMLQATFQEYLEVRLGKQFKVEDPFNQLEYMLTSRSDPDYDIRAAGIRYKASSAFLQGLLAYKETLLKEGMIFADIKFRGKTIVSADQIAERFYADPAIRLHNRVEDLTNWLLAELTEREKRELSRRWVDDAIELLDKEDYHRAHKEVRRAWRGKEESFDDAALERDILGRMVVRDRFRPLRRRVKGLRFIDTPAIYRRLFAEPVMLPELAPEHDIPGCWPEICTQTTRRLDRAELAYEDATPFLLLKDMIEGFRINTSVRHVIVDEAQDYSPFQFEFLKHLFPRSRMTALGDLNQAIYAHSSSLPGLDVLVGLYGEDDTEIIRLERSYRSTREIVEFTRGLVPGGEGIIPFNRSGPKPTLTLVPGTEALQQAVIRRIGYLRERNHNTIAVICATAKESRDAWEAMSGAIDGIRLITKETSSFETGIVVIPAYLAKGVEFDAVILHNASADMYRDEDVRKLLYTACTRAMHELHLYAVGEVSPFIAALDPDTFETTQF
jgi:DNA helicase-2/ATP-dependent DNA helicase PcrA